MIKFKAYNAHLIEKARVSLDKKITKERELAAAAKTRKKAGAEPDPTITESQNTRASSPFNMLIS